VSSQAAVLLLTDIAFALPAFAATALFVRTVVVFVVIIILVIFTVCIKGFRRLLRLISMA
jgi:hypothetical protein